jgi:hypothetical protein
MVALVKRWRDIAGSEGSVELVSEEGLAQRRSERASRVESHALCGYVEAPPVGYSQSLAGVACRYTYENAASADGVPNVEEEWVDLTVDADPRLRGTRVSYTRDANVAVLRDPGVLVDPDD